MRHSDQLKSLCELAKILGPTKKLLEPLQRIKKRARKGFCDRLRKRIMINPDGSVLPRCAYYPQKYDSGDIVHTSIKELWNSNKV